MVRKKFTIKDPAFPGGRKFDIEFSRNPKDIRKKSRKLLMLRRGK